MANIQEQDARPLADLLDDLQTAAARYNWRDTGAYKDLCNARAAIRRHVESITGRAAVPPIVAVRCFHCDTELTCPLCAPPEPGDGPELALREAYDVIRELAPDWSGSSIGTVLRAFLPEAGAASGVAVPAPGVIPASPARGTAAVATPPDALREAYVAGWVAGGNPDAASIAKYNAFPEWFARRYAASSADISVDGAPYWDEAGAGAAPECGRPAKGLCPPCDCEPVVRDGWTVERGVTCVVCPACAFTFDATHTDGDGDYSCPLCAAVAGAPAAVRPAAEWAAKYKALSYALVEEARKYGMRHDANDGPLATAIFRLDAHVLGTPAVQPSQAVRPADTREPDGWVIRHSGGVTSRIKSQQRALDDRQRARGRMAETEYHAMQRENALRNVLAEERGESARLRVVAVKEQAKADKLGAELAELRAALAFCWDRADADHRDVMAAQFEHAGLLVRIAGEYFWAWSPHAARSTQEAGE